MSTPRQQFELLKKSSLFFDSSFISFDPEKSLIGVGSVGSVYRAQFSGKTVCVKVFDHKPKLDAQDFLKDIEFLSGLNHNNIVLYMGFSLIENVFAVITEYVELTLENVIAGKTEQVLSLIQKVVLFERCCLGVQWLHNRFNLIHRNIKPSNFLIQPNLDVKICDFKFAESAKRPTKEFRGSLLYCAPEVYDDRYDKSLDIYSLGMTMWELFYCKNLLTEFMKKTKEPLQTVFCTLIKNGVRPTLPRKFMCKNFKKAENEKDGLKKKELQNEIERVKLSYNTKVPKNVENIIEECWTTDPSKRPDINQLIKMLSDLRIVFVVSFHSALMWWNTHFALGNSADEVVPIKTFVENLCDTFGVKEPSTINRLIEYLSENNQVNLEHFGFLIRLFGKFYKKKTLFAKMLKMCKADWYYPNYSREESQAKLTGSLDGTYLFRVSKKTLDYPLVLSRVVKGSIVHTRVSCTDLGDKGVMYKLETKTGIYSDNDLCRIVDVMTSMNVLKAPCSKEENYNPYS
ncbi:serine-threonine protein kinase, putative [Entamoeba invadens IP1]|uniref:serine-threonine protein kinase, putative n=1 Tax=Entamoeba invadens IP1 TaxID=370355 RepID=UPI0002C3E333|nr:serine-threonine protein kinase, putative [Entamoeba invadens IP1]ELP94048.1 serine-threonine protein kinase, putative [Entamoeba invadens IP1]|eukprot:XP_004260819.1 serine-threonine protein kinase, putative [Entamoeba invadens IP1]